MYPYSHSLFAGLYGHHLYLKGKRFTGQLMVGIDDDVRVSDFNDGFLNLSPGMQRKPYQLAHLRIL